MILLTEGTNTSTLNVTIQQPEDIILSSASTDICKSVKAAPTDPADWPHHLYDTVRIMLTSRGPCEVESHFTFPKGEDGKSRQHH